MPKRPRIPRPPPTPRPRPEPVPVAERPDLAALAPEEPSLFPEIVEVHKRRFLSAFALCGDAPTAAEWSHVGLRSHQRWVHDDVVYQAAFARAEQFAGDMVESQIFQLGLRGSEEQVWYKGTVVGTKRVYYPTLMLALMNALKPERYRWRGAMDHTHHISPALEALQRQWEQASVPMRTSPDAAPESIDAEYEPSPDPDARPPMPGAPTVADVFRALDELNSTGPIEPDPDENFEPEDASPAPPVTPLRTPSYPWQQWQQRRQP